ncbi:MAG: hypothetical protein R3E79_21900 [Caldilineaceae bacterium]
MLIKRHAGFIAGDGKAGNAGCIHLPRHTAQPLHHGIPGLFGIKVGPVRARVVGGRAHTSLRHRRAGGVKKNGFDVGGADVNAQE